MIKNMAGSKKTSPITKKQFEFILDELSDKSDFRMQILCHLLFRCVRIGDVLKTLIITNIYELNGTIKNKLEYTEEKTGKKRIIPIEGEKFLTALKNYFPVLTKQTNKLNKPLFYGKTTGTALRDCGVKKILQSFVGKRGIAQCSPHSFRKGGARFMYESGVRIEYICDVLNHHSTRTTEIYIDIIPEDIEKAMKCLSI